MLLNSVLQIIFSLVITTQMAQASSANQNELLIKKEVSVQKVEVRNKEGNATLDSNTSNEKGMLDKIIDKTKELTENSTEAVSSAASSAWNSTKKAAKFVGDKTSNYVKDYFKSTWEEAGKNVKEQEKQERQKQH